MKTQERSDYLGFAETGCASCNGLGTRRKLGRSLDAPCGCVLRSVFRACINRFRYCAACGFSPRTVSVETCNRGPKGRISGAGSKHIDYMADLVITARRTLDPMEYKCFTSYCLLGGDSHAFRKHLGLSRGNFWHLVYRVQERAGRAFIQTKPFCLIPSVYFTAARNTRPLILAPVPHPNGLPLRPPVKLLRNPLVDRIITLRLAGSTYKQIADALQMSGTPTKSGRPWSAGIAYTMCLPVQTAAEKLAA